MKVCVMLKNGEKHEFDMIIHFIKLINDKLYLVNFTDKRGKPTSKPTGETVEQYIYFDIKDIICFEVYE